MSQDANLKNFAPIKGRVKSKRWDQPPDGLYDGDDWGRNKEDTCAQDPVAPDKDEAAEKHIERPPTVTSSRSEASQSPASPADQPRLSRQLSDVVKSFSSLTADQHTTLPPRTDTAENSPVQPLKFHDKPAPKEDAPAPTFNDRNEIISLYASSEAGPRPSSPRDPGLCPSSLSLVDSEDFEAQSLSRHEDREPAAPPLPDANSLLPSASQSSNVTATTSNDKDITSVSSVPGNTQSPRETDPTGTCASSGSVRSRSSSISPGARPNSKPETVESLDDHEHEHEDLDPDLMRLYQTSKAYLSLSSTALSSGDAKRSSYIEPAFKPATKSDVQVNVEPSIADESKQTSSQDAGPRASTLFANKHVSSGSERNNLTKHSASHSSSSPPVTSASSLSAGGDPAKGHRPYKSMILDLISVEAARASASPKDASTSSEMSSGRGSPTAMERKSSLRSLQPPRALSVTTRVSSETLNPDPPQSRKTSVARPTSKPTFDFIEILSRGKSEERTKAFNEARLREFEHDTGINSWLEIKYKQAPLGIQIFTGGAPPRSSDPSKKNLNRAMTTNLVKPARKVLSGGIDASRISEKSTQVMGKSSRKARDLFSLGKRLVTQQTSKGRTDSSDY